VLGQFMFAPRRRKAFQSELFFHQVLCDDHTITEVVLDILFVLNEDGCMFCILWASVAWLLFLCPLLFCLSNVFRLTCLCCLISAGFTWAWLNWSLQFPVFFPITWNTRLEHNAGDLFVEVVWTLDYDADALNLGWKWCNFPEILTALVLAWTVVCP
jgi:hypothetical protein